MVRATQTVVSSLKVLSTLFKNAPRIGIKIRAKVLANTIRTSAKGKGKSTEDSGMNANDRLIRSNKEGSVSPP